MQLNKWMDENRYTSKEVSKLTGIKYARLCSILREEMEIHLPEIIAIDYFTNGEVSINDWLDLYFKQWLVSTICKKPVYKKVKK